MPNTSLASDLQMTVISNTSLENNLQNKIDENINQQIDNSLNQIKLTSNDIDIFKFLYVEKFYY